MPDITLCKGDGCPKKIECYRYRAVPTPRRQAYFMTPPVKPDGTYAYILALMKGDRVTDADQGTP